jgi:protein TonB
VKKAGEHPARSLGFLSRYHDGELSREEMADFDRHAERCADCRSAAAEYEAVLAMYREAAPDPADDHLAARISRRIDTEVRHRGPVRFVTLQIDLVWASVLAVALVGAIALYAVLARRPAGPVRVAENAVPQSSPAPPAAEPASPRSIASAPLPAPGRRASRAKEAGPAAPEEPESLAGAPFAPEPRPALAGPSAASAPAPVPSPVAQEAESKSAVSESPAREDALEPLPVGGDVSAPILIRRVAPIVSHDAGSDFASGSPVVIVAVISESGEVTQPKIVRSNPAWDGTVLRAVRQWRYRPALKDGKPVAAYLTITVNVDNR